MTQQSGGTQQIVVEKVGDAVVARPQVKLMDDDQLKTLARLIDEAAGAPEAGVARVVVDLAKVAILPSLALGVLVQVHNKCKAREQRLTLAGVQPQVRQVFVVTRLERLVAFAESGEKALG
jgi:anti-anti-sigma factor